MNCERCQTLLEDFIYDELEKARADAVSEHLGGCSGCTAVHNRLASENYLFRQVYEQTAVELSPEMWEEIRHRIHQEPDAVSFRPGNKESVVSGLLEWLFRPVVVRQLAFSAVLVALTVAVTHYFVGNQEDVKGPVVAGIDSGPSVSPKNEVTTLNDESGKPVPVEIITRPKPAPVRQLTERELLAQQISRAEREYLGAIKLLDTAIAKRRDEIDPSVFSQYEMSLALIDKSIESSRRAFVENPADLNASQFLLTAYSRKVELMQDIAMR